MNRIGLTWLRNANSQILTADDAALLLDQARRLQKTGPRQAKQLLVGKKLAVLCDSHEGAEAHLFHSAASDLGAHVSHVRPHFSQLSGPDQLKVTARMLGRLYDGIECQGLTRTLVDFVDRESGVLVYDGLASARHPTAALAQLLGKGANPGRLRELVLQTVLVSTLG